MARLLGHGGDIEAPPGQYLDLGPWTDRLRLRRCPTELLGDRADLIELFAFADAVEDGVPPDARGSAWWTEAQWEACRLIRRERERARDWMREQRREREQARQVG